MDKANCNVKATFPPGMNPMFESVDFGPTCGTTERTVLENLERERDQLIERLKLNTDAILLVKNNSYLQECFRKLQRAGAY